MAGQVRGVRDLTKPNLKKLIHCDIIRPEQKPFWPQYPTETELIRELKDLKKAARNK